jgi:Toprim domain
MMEIGTIVALLAARAPALARELLPEGHREGSEWVCPSLVSPFGCSVSVHISGARAGVWAAWAAGEAGDALDLVAGARFSGDKREALRWARQWLGCEHKGSPSPQRRPLVETPPPRPDTGEAARSRAAARLFFQAQSSIFDTPERYLLGRAIDLMALGRQPCALRFHHALWNAESQRTWPAMLAAITNLDGAIVAIHRTWIAEKPDGSASKAPLEHPKMSLGPYRGACIHLWRGSSGKPLKDAPKGETVVIGEGLEDSLTAACAAPDYRVLCAVSLSNLAAIVLPPAIVEIIILKQNDAPDSPAARGLDKAISAHRKQGRRVRLAIPPPQYKDLNDVARARATMMASAR